jgi:hypothetical protein
LEEENDNRLSFAWIETIVHGELPEQPGIAPGDDVPETERDKVKEAHRQETLKSAQRDEL